MYTGRQVPDKVCPDDGGILIVKSRRMRVRGSDDYVTEFVGCVNFETRGCRHTEALTEEIEHAIDSVVYDDQPIF